MTFRVLGFRVVALIGLAFTSFLVTDEFSRIPSFCPLQDGCASVAASDFGKPLGIPLSAIGLGAFATFFVVTFLPFPKVERWLVLMAIAAGIVGVLLVGVQFLVLKQVCRLCLVVDAAGMLLAAVALGVPSATVPSLQKCSGRWMWASLATVLVAIPPVWSALQPPPTVPDEVRQRWVTGKINVVEITDFNCPFCRSTHTALEELREGPAGNLHFIRIVAASRNDEEGVSAARAYRCAVRQGAGERMASELFQRETFSRDDMRQLAQQIGLDMARFDADFEDPAIDQEIESTRHWVQGQEFAGVPQIWVQDILLIGEQTSERLLLAVRRASAPQ